VKAVAKALGYEDTAALRKLIKRNKEEFVNKISDVILTPLGLQADMVINYHSVIRASMLSDALRAVEFRDTTFSPLSRVSFNDLGLVSSSLAVKMEDRAACLLLRLARSQHNGRSGSGRGRSVARLSLFIRGPIGTPVHRATEYSSGV
jgi:hypothetical protein